MKPGSVLLAAGLLALVPGSAAAQAGIAPDYNGFYQQLRAMQPLAERGADVAGVTLRRDAGTLVFQEGRIWELTPVEGRTVAIAFRGRGLFRFSPPDPVEQGRLRQHDQKAGQDQPFTSAVIFFADSTLDELTRRLRFGAGPVEADPVRNRVREALNYLGEENDKALDPDVLITLMNGERNDLFYAHLADGGNPPWMFMINPHEVEAVRYLARAKRTGLVRIVESVSQFRLAGDTGAMTGERRNDPAVASYRVESWLTQDMAADLSFRGQARMDVTTAAPAGPWIAFEMYWKARVDSVKLDSGERLEFFKANDYPVLLVRLPQRLAPGAMVPITVYYRGNMIDRFGEWFFVNSSIAWYPRAMDGRSYATFDLTFHYPRSLTLVSVGQRADSATEGQVTTTRWVTSHPIRNASFNIGIFDVLPLTEAGLPPVTLYWSYQGHRELRREGLGAPQRNADRVVGADVTSALKFFQTMFGEFPEPSFFATEIPDAHGEAFPGMINLSYLTFYPNTGRGDDEQFRAHEVAHQWWGIGVDYATYRDRWISEGFADFSGLWYLQKRRNDNRLYFDMLDRWKADILLRRNEALPIILGHRVATASQGEDYSAIIYKKGAWVLHMLRILTLDLSTMNEDRFAAIMREFYQSYRGNRASTADFQQIVEQRLGADMDWFFNQWVYGTAIPTYRFSWTSSPRPDGQHTVRLRVQQENVPPEFLAFVPVTVELSGNRMARARIRVTGAVTEVDFPGLLPEKPRAVRFNDLNGVLAEVK